ncbi:Cytochrome P450 71B1 [Dendrobium catenatum]|uniref:Cytochrome P450 71B1 n=1 Tax=Dendrobium catenatum TaxID=906689 RepID=A0A2I0WJR4_9ASPA|nr:Cytochrome P450 71B1 [Dendrobium catenatum]
MNKYRSYLLLSSLSFLMLLMEESTIKNIERAVGVEGRLKVWYGRILKVVFGFQDICYDVSEGKIGCLVGRLSEMRSRLALEELPGSIWDHFPPAMNMKNRKRGHDFELLPFGSGRRMCPGYTLGLRVIQSSLANILHGFSWRLPDGVKAEELSMDEIFGLSNPKREPLVAVAEPRLPLQMYLSS